MTPEERARLEYAYDRLRQLYESGDIRPAEMDELYRIDDAMRPTWTAEAAEAEPEQASMTPTAYDPAADLSAPQLGLGSRVGNEDLAAGRALALDPDASMYSLLDPEGRYADTPLGYFNQAVMRAPDLALGGLLAMFGGAQKAAGHVSDLLGLGLQPGDIPNAEEAFQVADALYALPTARMAGAVSSAASRSAADTGRRFIADEAGSIPLGRSLPAPRNEAEAVAREILEMRAAGRAGDVTDELMAQADPQYMFANTSLPMDEASRMARRDALYGKDRYHGSNMDFQGFSGDVFTSDNPTVASTYNRGMLDGQIYPVVTRDGPMGTVTVDGAGARWNHLSPEMFDDAAVARGSAFYPHPGTGKLSTRGTQRAAAFEGRSGVTFKDIHDLGPGFNSQQFKGVGYTPEQAEALRQQYLAELSVPSEIDVRLSPNLVRSRFARFDPEFRHLRNLSAGVGGLGLLATQSPEQQREDELRQYLGGLL